MRWAHFFIFVLATTFAKEKEINEVNPPRKLTANLDANLRRALLKALTELENEENQSKHLQSSLSNDRIVEKASASALSFYASTESPVTEKTSTTTEEVTPKQIVIIQRSHGSQHKPILTSDNEHEQILTSASSSFTSSSSKFFTKETQSPNLVSDEVKATTKFVRLPKVETTTVTTTTSTEESEAKVEDVQFFSAPLVAAFTVHQDERGLPKSVEPIFRSKVEQKVKTPLIKQETLNQQEQLRTQLALQEKQKALEAEIMRLKQQQQQQNYLIRQQQLLHQQQLQLQKQKILDEQNRIRSNQQSFVPLVNTNSNIQHTTQRNEFSIDPAGVRGNLVPFQQTTQRNEFNSVRGNSLPFQQTTQRGTLVSFQPSISFTSHQHPSGVLPFNAQHLPLKNAVNFRTSFASNDNIQQFNYLSQQQPPLETSVSSFDFVPTVRPQLSLTAQPPLESSVSSFNFVPTVRPQLSLTVPKHHRVFRQEANTGNFFNNFNQALPQQNAHRFFRSNAQTFNFNRAQPPIVNQQLNHLLYNSGLIRGNKQQEDLNIVSKVLALNHYGGDYRFDSSNVHEQRVPSPLIKEV